MKDGNAQPSCVRMCTAVNQRNKWRVQQQETRSDYLRSRSKFQRRYVKRCGHDPSMHPVPCVPAILARVNCCAACSSDMRVQTFPPKPGSTIEDGPLKIAARASPAQRMHSVLRKLVCCHQKQKYMRVTKCFFAMRQHYAVDSRAV